jgi:O-antigen/teichoic acid export membrane protein
MSVSENNRRIAKNTLALYFRTFITMIVGLYTGRVMLQALGVENYGINAVVGGIVGMSALITSTMSQAISRYITYALGKGEKEGLKTMFSTSISAQIVMALVVVLVLEVVGVWFLNSGANIPEGRMEAANWVLQCSIVSLIISLVGSPFGALIIAHERMAIYAYMSIVDVTLKLVICFVIMAYGGDRLILLALLQVAIAFGMQIFYGWYCGRNFEEAHYNPQVFDKGLMKELTAFSGWNLMNNGAYVFATQGVNMLINVFFGVVYNASRSVAMTVNGAIQSFVGNFTIAFSPQITKSYAAGDTSYAVHLVIKGTKFTWLMMYIFIVPVFMEADILLQLWLGEVPEQAALFLRFAMFESLAVSSGQNLFKLIQADGHVKKYTIHAAITAGFIFPLTWLSFYLGAPVWTAYLIFIIIFLILNLVRFYALKRLMPFSIRQFMKDAIIPCLIVSVASFIVPIIVAYYMEQSVIRFFVNGTVSVLWTIVCCVLFGLTKNERFFFYDKAKLLINKYIKI